MVVAVPATAMPRSTGSHVSGTPAANSERSSAMACCCNAGETASSASQRSVARTQPASSETARPGPTETSVDPPPTSTMATSPSIGGRPASTPSRVSRASSSPGSRRASKPVSACSRLRNSPPLAESRTALVAVARRTCAPCESAISR